MKIRIVITPDGQIALFSDTGTFTAGKEQLEKLLASLQADGVQFSEVGQVEQHRHDGEHVHDHTHTHDHTH